MPVNILSDLDGTVLDTVRLVEDFKNLLVLHGITREQVDAYYACDPDQPDYQEYRSHTYYLIERPGVMAPIFGLSRDRIKSLQFDMISLLAQMPNYIFPEAWGYMENMRLENSILITYGWVPFQRAKIELSGIASNFRHVIITAGKRKTDVVTELKSAGVIDNSQIFLVDDRGKEITEIKASHPEVVAIWMYRDHNNRNHECAEARDYKVNDLAEAGALIQLLSTTAQSGCVKLT
jgi:hypothetical protein